MFSINRVLRELNSSNLFQKLFSRRFLYISSMPILLLCCPAKSNALAIGPLKLYKPFGRLRVVNDAKRFKKINLITYPAILTDEQDYTIQVTGFDDQNILNAVEYTPSVARVSAGGSKYVNYSINRKGNYYLCAESVVSERFKFRVCSLYLSDY